MAYDLFGRPMLPGDYYVHGLYVGRVLHSGDNEAPPTAVIMGRGGRRRGKWAREAHFSYITGSPVLVPFEAVPLELIETLDRAWNGYR